MKTLLCAVFFMLMFLCASSFVRADTKNAPRKNLGQTVTQKNSGILVPSKKKPDAKTKVLDEIEYVAPSASVIFNTSDAVTLKGKLFYNDLRTDGRFEFRKDENGNTGAGTTWSCTPKGTSNYLSALDVVADFYEVDLEGSGSNCKEKEDIGSATVGSDGSYSITFSNAADLDDCAGDGDNKVQIGVSFRLRFCNLAEDSTADRCFYVGTEVDEPYVLWHADASADAPYELSANRGGTYDLGTRYFQTSGTAGDPEDMAAQAANHYASLVDLTRVWHREGGVPFVSDYGAVYLLFPSEEQEERASGASCTTYSAQKILCLDPEPDDDDVTSSCPSPEKWPNGEGVMHEYGHVIHNRAWEDTTGECGDCDGGQYARGETCGSSCSWSATSLEYPHPAFNEGWANFVSKVARGTCEDADFDNNTSSDGEVMPEPDASDSPPYAPEEGEGYARNVAKLLCDWYDSQNDDDPDRAGNGDHFAADTLYSVWRNLENMWDTYESENDEGLNLCHYINYYLYTRKSEDAVGEESHEEYVASIADLAYNNGVSCGLPEPQGDFLITSVSMEGGFMKFTDGKGQSVLPDKGANASLYKTGKFKVTLKNKNYPYTDTQELAGPNGASHDVTLDKTPNSTETETFSVRILTDASGMPDASYQTLIWTLDPDNEITDTDRSNNTYTVTLKPDYKAGIADVKQTCKGENTAKGGMCTLYVSCGISNNGMWDGVKTTTVSLKVTGKGMQDKMATQSLSPLGVDASELVGFTLMTAKSTNGTLTVTCSADADGALDELDESDNTASAQFRVTSGKSALPDFTPPSKTKADPADWLQPKTK